ncbi:hypothetical protein HanRHA438_Chr14g0635751 [Helianthus annuus]|nr:hypothetical protein HanRHA438_Chr14g0635751 [Helianthus annuus]
MASLYSDTPCAIHLISSNARRRMVHSSDTPCAIRPISSNARRRMVHSSDTPCAIRPISSNAWRRMVCASSDAPCASSKLRQINTNARRRMVCTSSIPAHVGNPTLLLWWVLRLSREHPHLQTNLVVLNTLPDVMTRG